MKKLFLFLITLIFTAGAYAQSGTIMLSNDAQSAGRGGTSIGVFNSYELMMSNPAGLSFIKNSSVNINLSVMRSQTYFKNTLNDTYGKTNYNPLPDLGYVHAAKKNSRWSWGIGAFTQGGMGADFSLKNELYRAQTFALNSSNNTYYPVKGAYEPQTYHSKFALMEFGPSLAYKISDKFSVGISVHMVYSMMEFQMPFGMNPSIMAGEAMPGMTFGQMFAASPSQGGFGYNEVIASANMDHLNTISWTGKIGFAYKASKKLSFGLNLNLPVNLNFKNGKATMDMSAQFNDAFGRAIAGFYQNPSNQGVSLNDAMAAVTTNFSQMGIDVTKGFASNYDLNLNMKMPLSIGFGMAYQTTSKLNLALDVIWTNWANAFDKMEMTLSNGTNSNINTMLGASGFTYNFPLNWKNTVTIKVGGEYQFTKRFAFRAGYAYNNNPVPSSTLFPIFPAIVENHLTVGGSYLIGKKLTINAAVEGALFNKQNASDPSAIQSEFSGSTSGLKTIIGHISFSYKL